MAILPFLVKSQMKKKIIHFSRFVPTVNLGGGARRTLQIVEIFEPFNPGFISTSKGGGIINPTTENISLKKKIHLKHYFREDGDLKYWSTFDIKTLISKTIKEDKKPGGIFKTGKEYELWSKQYRGTVNRLRTISGEWSEGFDLSGLKLAVVDDPIYFAPLVEKLEECRVPMIAICHNLETLAPAQVETDPARSLFVKEIDLLARCRLVITISREETFLLHNLGINTLFFPYYPVEPILNRLLQVREKRKKTKKKGILLLGNALNLQTRQGMKKMIEYWEANNLYREHGKLIAAGYGMGQYLKNVGSSSAAEFLGTLSNDELDSRLTRVKACLCFQESGSGALTRICEMLIAGVPVLANSHAARSYYNVNGMIEFRDLQDLEKALKQIDGLEGEIPGPMEPDPSYLVSEIKNTIDKRSNYA